MKTLLRQIPALALLTWAASASAVPTLLDGLTANTLLVPTTTSYVNGIGAYDIGAVPLSGYRQAFNIGAPSGARLEEIVWWGFVDGGTYTKDAFEVRVNGGAIKKGNLVSGPDNSLGTPTGLLAKYTLTLDAASQEVLGAGAGMLEILNNENDFGWYWQGHSNTMWDGLSSFSVAYSLLGTAEPVGVPEPGSLALVALAGLGLLAAQRKRAV